MNNKDDFFDVGKKYFGVPIDNDKLERVSCNDMCCDLQNNLVNREDAIKFIEESYKTEEESWYCSENAIKGRDIKDYLGRKIFPDDIDNLIGWIFMWDKQPFANWSHECEYFFVYGDKECVHSLYNVGLLISIQMAQI